MLILSNIYNLFNLYFYNRKNIRNRVNWESSDKRYKVKILYSVFFVLTMDKITKNTWAITKYLQRRTEYTDLTSVKIGLIFVDDIVLVASIH